MQVSIPGVSLFSLGNPFSALVVPGKLFFLNDQATLTANADADAATDPTTPAKTGAAVILFATANRGDVIIVGPKHSQSLATLLALAAPATTTFIHEGLGISWTVGGFGQTSTAIDGPSGERVVQRAASITPPGGNQTIFTVVGGAIEIISLEGLTTVVFPVTTNTLKLTAVPTGLSGTDLCAASADITNAAAGTIFWVTGTFATAMQIATNQTHISQLGKITLYPGIVRLTTTATSATGQISWYLRYRALQPGAYVVAS